MNEIGSYFLDQLNLLKQKYPNKINKVIGKGLYLGIEFNFSPYDSCLKALNIPFVNDMRIALMGSIIRCLYKDFGLLTHFTPPRPTLLILMPPLIIDKKQIDYFISSIDIVLEKLFINLLSKFVYQNVKDLKI